jgi:hypothetical protein
MEIKLRISNLQKVPFVQTPQGQQPAVQVQTTVEVDGFTQPPNMTPPAISFMVPVAIGDKFHIDEVFVAHLSHELAGQ